MLSTIRFSTLRCGSWIDAAYAQVIADLAAKVSVPFDAGRGLMPSLTPPAWPPASPVSVPFDAGRGLMPGLGVA